MRKRRVEPGLDALRGGAAVGSRTLRHWVGALAIGWILGSGYAVEVSGKDQRPGAGNAEAESRQILVTFADERVGRVGIGDTVASYRRRGDYGNSTWSERLAGALALDYGLTQRGLWPITSLGVHCVVYELKPDQSLNDLLVRLQRDARVESVQALHAYRAMSEEPPAPRHRPGDSVEEASPGRSGALGAEAGSSRHD